MIFHLFYLFFRFEIRRPSRHGHWSLCYCMPSDHFDAPLSAALCVAFVFNGFGYIESLVSHESVSHLCAGFALVFFYAISCPPRWCTTICGVCWFFRAKGHHKTVDTERNIILRIYYGVYVIFAYACVSCETTYIVMYVLHFWPEASLSFGAFAISLDQVHYTKFYFIKFE